MNCPPPRFPPRFLPLLPALTLLTSCSDGRKANQSEPAPAAPTAEGKPAAEVMPAAEGGTLRSVIDYGTGATQIKAGQDAKKKLEAIGAERDAQLKEAFE